MSPPPLVAPLLPFTRTVPRWVSYRPAVVLTCAPQPHVVDVDDRHEHRRLIRQDAQVEETARRAEDGLLLDLLHDAETMVRVNDLVANHK
jgi:hypothetical protein